MSSGKPGSFVEAIRQCDLAIAKYKPENAEFYHLSKSLLDVSFLIRIEAIAYLKTESITEALTSINASLSSKPLSKDYLLTKAQILESAQSFSESLKILSGLREADSTSSPAIDETYNRIKSLIDSNNGSLMMRKSQCFRSFRK